MKNSKKGHRYEMSTLSISMLSKHIRREGGFSKKISDEQCIGALMSSNTEIRGTMTYASMIEEYFFKTNGMNVIFPDSESLVRSLINSKLTYEHLNNLELPVMPSMMVPSIKGMTIDGIPLLPMIVNRYRYDHSGDLLIEPFEKAIGHGDVPRRVMVDDHIEGEFCTTIIQPLNDAVMRLLLTDSQVTKVMKCQSLDEMRDHLICEAILSEDQTDEEMLQQIHGLKLAIGLSVYHQATNSEQLRSGLPNGLSLRTASSGKFIKGQKSFTLQSHSDIRSESKGSVRRGHFRQLNHDKYYQNEHACKPRGSRWTYVRESLVGLGDAYTLEGDNL